MLAAYEVQWNLRIFRKTARRESNRAMMEIMSKGSIPSVSVSDKYLLHHPFFDQRKPRGSAALAALVRTAER